MTLLLPGAEVPHMELLFPGATIFESESSCYPVIGVLVLMYVILKLSMASIKCDVLINISWNSRRLHSGI